MLSRKILRLFDELGSATLDSATLAARLPATGDELRVALEALVQAGSLRLAAGQPSYTRTEDGRLAVAPPLEVTLYTRAGCQLCDEAKAQIAPLLREFGGTLREVDVDADVTLHERYSLDVPVIFVGPRKAAKHRVDLAQFRRQLAQAQRDSQAQAED